MPATITGRLPDSRPRRGSTGCSAGDARPTISEPRRKPVLAVRERPRTASRTGGTCRSERVRDATASEERARARDSDASSAAAFPEHLVEPLAEPRSVVARQAPRRARGARSGRSHGRPASRPTRSRQPSRSLPLHSVPLHGRAPEPFGTGDAEPRLAVVVAREPVEDEEPRRDRAAVAVDGIEVPRAGESVPALHSVGATTGAASGEPLPALRAAALQDRLARRACDMRARKPCLRLRRRDVGLVGPLHRGLGHRKRRPSGTRARLAEREYQTNGFRADVLHRPAVDNADDERPSRTGVFDPDVTPSRRSVHTCGERCGTRRKALQNQRFSPTALAEAPIVEALTRCYARPSLSSREELGAAGGATDRADCRDASGTEVAGRLKGRSTTPPTARGSARSRARGHRRRVRPRRSERLHARVDRGPFPRS